MTRARNLADLGGDATGLATDAELTSGLASKADKSAGYQYHSTVYYTSNGTFAKADYPWLRAIRVKVQGGGGGGGGAGTSPYYSSGGAAGGGSGGYAEKFITDIDGLAASISVTVGAGGAGGAAGNNNGSDGGASIFDTSPAIQGGAGGGGLSAYAPYNTNKGGAASGGDFNVSGGDGFVGHNEAGGNGSDSMLGIGGTGQWLSQLGLTGGPGSAGKGYGAGGGGAFKRTADWAGSAGAPGIVIVELYA